MSTVGLCCLHLAHHTGRTGAGAGSELTWPRPAATLGPWLDPSVSSIRKPYACVLSTVRHQASCRNASEWSTRVPFRNPVQLHATASSSSIELSDRPPRRAQPEMRAPSKSTFEHVGSVRGKGKVERPPRPGMRRRARSWRRHARHRCL